MSKKNRASDGLPRIRSQSQLVQSRVPRDEVTLLRKARVDIPQLIRDAVHEAVLRLKKA